MLLSNNKGLSISSNIENSTKSVSIQNIKGSKVYLISIVSSKPIQSISLKNISLNETHGFVVKNAETLKIYGVTLNQERCTNCEGISIENISNLSIIRVKTSYGSAGFRIVRSKGIIEDCEISNIKSLRNVYGGGIYINGNSEIRLKNVNMIGNNAVHGAAFYCGTATLNMIGGKIHNNDAASSGGAGQCDPLKCAFFVIGTDFKNNTQRASSACRGIPN